MRGRAEGRGRRPGSSGWSCRRAAVCMDNAASGLRLGEADPAMEEPAMEEPEMEEPEMEEAETEEAETEEPGTSGSQVSRSPSGPAGSPTLLPPPAPHRPCPPTPPHTPQPGPSLLTHRPGGGCPSNPGPRKPRPPNPGSPLTRGPPLSLSASPDTERSQGQVHSSQAAGEGTHGHH